MAGAGSEPENDGDQRGYLMSATRKLWLGLAILLVASFSVLLWAGGEMTRRVRKTLPGVVLIPELASTVGALKMRVHRARESLQALLEEKYA